MIATFNSERGEVPLTVGGVELVVAATMGGLAQVSSRLGCQSFGELFRKLTEVEINAVMAGVELLAVRGDTGKALKAMSIADLPACRTAFLAAMMHHADRVPAGNVDAAGETTGNSPGGHGKKPPTAASDGPQSSSGDQP